MHTELDKDIKTYDHKTTASKLDTETTAAIYSPHCQFHVINCNKNKKNKK